MRYRLIFGTKYKMFWAKVQPRWKVGGEGIDVDSRNKIFVTGFTRNGNSDNGINSNDLLYLKYNSSGDKQ